MDERTLKELIKESIKEVIREERLNLYKILMPEITDEELAEVESTFGVPNDYDSAEFVSMTDWVKNGD